MLKTSAFAALALMFTSTAFAADVKLKTDDGLSIAGSAYGKGERGVLLVHGQGRSRADWHNFGEKLSHNGFSVLTVDLRGHGASGGEITDETWPLMVKDVTAAVGWLIKNGAVHVSVIGAEVGANLALNGANGNEDIDNVIMLSPGLNIHGVKVSTAIGAYGERPLLLIADPADATSARAAGLIADKVKGKKKLELLAGAGSGVQMLNKAASVEGLLVGWLNDAYGGSEDLKGTKREVGSGEVTDIETSGTRFGEKDE